MSEKIQINLNGKIHSLEANPDEPLLYVLREDFQLNGLKYGCGMQQCGSCMVLADGEATPTCVLPVSYFEGKKIETIEGLHNGEKLHPVQETFIEEQAAQCGYCLNGMMMASVALLREIADPSDSEIRDALEPVICRCGTHSRFIKAVKQASLKIQNH